MIAASFLQGAKSRLLPPSIPFRFFLAAAVFHVAAWVMLGLGADQVVGFSGAPGFALAALHLATLGVLATTVIGATLQLLPVATKLAIGSLWPPRLVGWLMLPGVALLSAGMAAPSVPAMAGGGILVAAALGLFALVIGRNLRRATSLGLVIAHAWCALAALAGVLGLGLALVWDYEGAFLPDRAAAGLAHLTLGLFGFMGLLIFGFSTILLPMFALSPAPSPGLGRAALGLACAAVALGAMGALAGSALSMGAALAVGLAATGLHLLAIERSLRRRMRKRLGISFVLIRAGQAGLVLALIIGLLVVAGAPIANGATLFGWIALAGWLLTFLLGILQRILPFLASMHAAKAAGRVPLLSELAPEMPLRVHAACHAAAVLFVAAGIALGNPLAVRIGAAAGLAGAMAFLGFALAVISHLLPRRPAGIQAPPTVLRAGMAETERRGCGAIGGRGVPPLD